MYFSTQKRMVHVTVTATKNTAVTARTFIESFKCILYANFMTSRCMYFIEFFFKCMILMSLCMYVVCVGVSLKWHKPFHVHIHLVHSGKIYMCYKSPHFIMTHEIMHCTS